MFLYDRLYRCLDLVLVSDITWTAPNISISSWRWQCFDGFIDIVDFSADDVDRASMEKERFGDGVADTCGSTTYQCQFAFKKIILKDWRHVYVLSCY